MHVYINLNLIIYMYLFPKNNCDTSDMETHRNRNIETIFYNILYTTLTHPIVYIFQYNLPVYLKIQFTPLHTTTFCSFGNVLLYMCTTR